MTTVVSVEPPRKVELCGVHAAICSLRFGANYCSCGSDINDYEGPLYEESS